MSLLGRREFVAGAIACTTCSVFAETPASRFGAESTAEDVTEDLDLSGKTAVVTGCNSGIGFETMRVLALRGARVIGTARTDAKGREACAAVVGDVTSVVLELTDFCSVLACAARIRAMTPAIDMLILNAGILQSRLEQVYGLEKHFVVNHLGHFLLTRHLLDRIVAASQGRIVTVGSGNHHEAPAGGIQFDDLSGKSWPGYYYHHSKLANGLFSLELATRLKGTSATSNCVTPGSARTKILRYIGGSTAHQTKSIAQGAATQCYVATHPLLARVSGEYFRDCSPAPQSEHQRDAAMARRLWDVSAQLTASYSRC